MIDIVIHRDEFGAERKCKLQWGLNLEELSPEFMICRTTPRLCPAEISLPEFCGFPLRAAAPS